VGRGQRTHEKRGEFALKNGAASSILGRIPNACRFAPFDCDTGNSKGSGASTVNVALRVCRESAVWPIIRGRRPSSTQAGGGEGGASAVILRLSSERTRKQFTAARTNARTGTHRHTHTGIGIGTTFKLTNQSVHAVNVCTCCSPRGATASKSNSNSGFVGRFSIPASTGTRLILVRVHR